MVKPVVLEFCEAYAPFTSHGHYPDCIFRIRVDFCLENGVDSVRLGIETGGDIISIPHILGIVNYQHGSFERHFGQKEVTRPLFLLFNAFATSEFEI
jgi:hypothetical protein